MGERVSKDSFTGPKERVLDTVTQTELKTS